MSQWTTDGVAISTAIFDQSLLAAPSDGNGGAIAAWLDPRPGNTTLRPVVQRVDRFGMLGAEPAIHDVRDIPNDQGGKVKVSWDASPLDLDPLFSTVVSSYRVFRSTPPQLVEQALRAGRVSESGDEVEEMAAAGSLLHQRFDVTDYYWELMATVTADHLPGYSLEIASTGDSIAGSNPLTAFMVEARNGAATQAWQTPPDSGYSVDNLPPVAPAPFTGQYQGALTRLHWNPNSETDLAGYRLYRGANTSFTPGPANRIAALTDTGYVDNAGLPFVYKLTAIDAHGNESPVATLLPSATVDAPGAGQPRELALASPTPNPARGSSTVRFALPREARITLAIFDASGRRVRTLADGIRPAGDYSTAWDLRAEDGAPAPSGLYFVRLATEGRMLVQRIAAMH